MGGPQGLTQDTLESLYVFAGLRMLWDSPRAGGCGCLDSSSEASAPATWTWIGRRSYGMKFVHGECKMSNFLQLYLNWSLRGPWLTLVSLLWAPYEIVSDSIMPS